MTAAELPGQAGLFPAPCGCYSCNGQCGGTSEPGSCGPLLAIAGERICEACRERADVFGTDSSDREGIRSAPRIEGVELDAGVFGGHARVIMTPAMARALVRKIAANADLVERYQTRQADPGCLCDLHDRTAYCPVHNRG
jgi:hypothetical protein